jgi:hypothetical protein
MIRNKSHKNLRNFTEITHQLKYLCHKVLYFSECKIQSEFTDTRSKTDTHCMLYLKVSVFEQGTVPHEYGTPAQNEDLLPDCVGGSRETCPRAIIKDQGSTQTRMRRTSPELSVQFSYLSSH